MIEKNNVLSFDRIEIIEIILTFSDFFMIGGFFYSFSYLQLLIW